MRPGIIAGLITSHPAAAIPLIFLGGVLTSLTPCIYPMIPITAAIVGGEAVARQTSMRRPAAMTAAYVIGLALAYATLGLVAGLTGQLFGAISTNPWLYFLLGNCLALFGCMMLDLVPVPVPRGWMNWAASLDGHGRLAGTFAMGAASGLVAAPCGAPVMATLLTWVSATHDAALGFLYLFAFSLGMCALLVVVGLTAGGVARLPRAGRWMLWIKRGFAVLMFGVAEYYLVQMGTLLS